MDNCIMRSPLNKVHPSGTSVRHMREDEVKEVFEMIHPEGWDLNLPKLKLLFQAIPEAFYVLVNETDEIVATFSMFPTYNDEYILGNMVVKKSERGLGLGKWIVTELVHTIKSSAVSFFAVPEATEFYLKIGLHLSDPVDVQVVSHVTVKPKLLESHLSRYGRELENIQIFPLDQDRVTDLIDYDNSVRTYDNTRHTRIVSQYCEVVMAEETKTHRIVGYGAAFIHRGEIVFDGLFADTDAVALALLREILNEFPGLFNIKLQMLKSKQLLGETGQLTDSYDYIRFSYGSPTVLPEDKVYCVSDCDYTV